MNPWFLLGGTGLLVGLAWWAFTSAQEQTAPVRATLNQVRWSRDSAAFAKNYAEGDSMFALADQTPNARVLAYAPALGGAVINPKGGRGYFDLTGTRANLIRELQLRLIELAIKHGDNRIHPGRADGSLGRQTAVAIQRYQSACKNPEVKLEGTRLFVGPATAVALGFQGRVDREQMARDSQAWR